jgi:hypothetical protein
MFHHENFYQKQNDYLRLSTEISVFAIVDKTERKPCSHNWDDRGRVREVLNTLKEYNFQDVFKNGRSAGNWELGTTRNGTNSKVMVASMPKVTFGPEWQHQCLHIWRSSPPSATWGRAMLWQQYTHNSAVCIANGYGLDDRGLGVRAPVSSRIFASPYCPDRLWSSPSFLSNGYREILIWG